MATVTVTAAQNLQDTYDVGPTGRIVLSAANGPVEIADAAAPLGTRLFGVEDNAGAVSYLDVQAARTLISPRLLVEDAAASPLIDAAAANVQIGLMGASEAMQVPVSTTKDAVLFLPDAITDVGIPANFGLATWNSTYTADFAAARFGGMIYAIGVFEARQNMNGLNELNLFLNAATIRNASGVAANFGSSFTLIDQPTYEAQASAGRTKIQHNGVRSFPTFTRTGGGTLTTTFSDALIAGCTVTTGNVLTTRRVVDAFSPTVTGTLTNNIIVEILNQTTGTTRRGIRSAMASGQHFEFTGAAVSSTAGDIHFNNGVSCVFGSVGAASRVELLRPSAGVLRMIGVAGTNNEGLDIDLDPAVANNILVTTSTASGLTFALGSLVFGADSGADPTASNWNVLFNPGARTVTVGGDFFRRLFSASAGLTLNAAMTNVFTDAVNEPIIAGGSGSAVNTGNVLIQTSPTFGTNRYGLLITANPSGGTLNYAFRQSNASALARFDGRLDINRSIALGGGAAATLGTIGGSGPTAAAQAIWIEIDVGTVATWLAGWR